MAARFLADESCDFAVVRALRDAAFDVVAVVERSPGATDDEVIALSVKERRVLLTEDKDFGQLVFAANREAAGVILVRFPASARGSLGVRVVETVQREQDRLSGAFVVLQPRRTRITRLPGLET
jgi:predicted nuclease of predicted toxin-antitoxin system